MPKKYGNENNGSFEEDHARKGNNFTASLEMEEETKTSGICGKIPARYVLTLMGFWGFFNIYAMRVNLSVAIVAMVNQTYQVTSDDNMTEQIECKELIQNQITTNDVSREGTYNWDSSTQSMILGSFFYGYVVLQIPGGVMAVKWGAKWFFGIGVGITALFSLIIPLAAEWGTTAFIIVRVIEGLAEGVTYPAMHTLISRWSPKYERSRLTTIIYTGIQIGSAVAMPISGRLCSSDVLGGWPSVFYLFGTIGCIWFVFWIFLIYDYPADHPRISKTELFLINEGMDDRKPRNISLPWKSIVTSIPVWALMITHFGHNWGFLIFLTEMPTYFSSILHFDIEKNGILSALPYFLQALVAWLISYIADRVRRSGRFRINTIRKTINTIGFFGPAMCLVGVTMSGCQPRLIVSLLCLGLAFNGFVYSGFNVTHVDMSPELAGILMGITNGFSNLNGFLGPALVGYFTSKGKTIENWNTVFYITAGIYVFTAIIYITFANAELQPWGLATTEKKTDCSKKENTDSSLYKVKNDV